MDEFVDELLHSDRVCDIILPRLQVSGGEGERKGRDREGGGGLISVRGLERVPPSIGCCTVSTTLLRVSIAISSCSVHFSPVLASCTHAHSHTLCRGGTFWNRWSSLNHE